MFPKSLKNFVQIEQKLVVLSNGPEAVSFWPKNGAKIPHMTVLDSY